MQVSATHTSAIFRNGIMFSLPQGINLLAGPGSAGCVTDQRLIDAAFQLANRNDCIIAAVPEILTIPIKGESLESMIPSGKVSAVDNPAQAFELAKKNPSKTVIFTAVEFEAALPATALTIKQAADDGIDNFCILNGHKRITAAMIAMVNKKHVNIDAFLCPANGSSLETDEFIEKYNIPCVNAGTDPMNIIEALAEICRQLKDNNLKSVSFCDQQSKPSENDIVKQCFNSVDSLWPGLGNLEKSAFTLKPAFKNFDALERFKLDLQEFSQTPDCNCHEILQGIITPAKCPSFDNECNPQNPSGSCMAVPSGTCALWFKFNRKRKK